MLDFNDMTVKELAYKTGISKRSIENYLNARSSMPPADYACKIATALNTTVEYLVTGKEKLNDEKSYKSESFVISKMIAALSETDKSAVVQIVKSLNKNA